MVEQTMMVTLNGEALFNDRGSELAAKDFEIKDGLQAVVFLNDTVISWNLINLEFELKRKLYLILKIIHFMLSIVIRHYV